MPGLRVVTAASLGAAKAWIGGAGANDTLKIALIDLMLPDGSGMTLIEQLRRDRPDTMPVVVTTYDDDANLTQAMALGAQGFLLKHHDRETLIRCLRRIEDGEPPLTPSIARRILAHFQRRSAAVAPASVAAESEESLTPREAEVLGLLARGSRVVEVAARLGLTEQTVATYVKIIYRKLRISSRAEAALEAARRGLV